MSRIAKADVSNALSRVAQNIIDAAGADGISSRADVAAKVSTLSGTEKALTDRFFRFIDHRDFKTNARVTKSDVERALAYAQKELLADYDVNNNGFSKSEIVKMSVTGQLAVTLACEIKGITPPVIGKPTSELGKLFTKAAENTYYISESDSQPAFISATFAANKALTGENIMAAFKGHLASAFDEQSGDLSAYTFEKQSGADARELLTGLATARVDDDDYYKEMAAGFGRIKKVFDENLTEVTVLRVGPRDEDNPSQLAVDQGAYQYLLVGRTADGKLAGVAFESVET